MILLGEGYDESHGAGADEGGGGDGEDPCQGDAATR